MTVHDPNRPLCFVLMPFGEKSDGKGGSIDFDAVYQQIIQPAIVGAQMEPIRADEEKIHEALETVEAATQGMRLLWIHELELTPEFTPDNKPHLRLVH